MMAKSAKAVPAARKTDTGEDHASSRGMLLTVLLVPLLALAAYRLAAQAAAAPPTAAPSAAVRRHHLSPGVLAEEEGAAWANATSFEEFFEAIVPWQPLRGAWMRAPLFFGKALPFVRGFVTLERDVMDLVEAGGSGFFVTDATRKDVRSWTAIVDKSKQRGSRPMLQEALNDGVAAWNNAGALWPSLGRLSRLAQRFIGLPSNANVYVQGASGGEPVGFEQGIPLHNDKQDVFILQTEGRKRWRVYAPPHQSTVEGTWIYNRGKEGNVLRREHVPELLVDVVLAPGEVLYIPAMFPHETAIDETAIDDAYAAGATGRTVATHVTLGFETHTYGFDYWFLQNCFRIKFGGPSLSKLLNKHMAEVSDEEAADLHHTPGFGAIKGSKAERLDHLCKLLRIGERFGDKKMLPDGIRCSEVTELTDMVLAFFDGHLGRFLAAKDEIHDPEAVAATPAADRAARNARIRKEKQDSATKEMEGFCTDFNVVTFT